MLILHLGYKYIYILYIPPRELTYPTWGKGKSSSNMPYQGDMLIPWRVYIYMIDSNGCVHKLDD